MLRYAILFALALALAGCASAGPATPVPVADVSSFTGHWSGWITSPTLSTRAMTVVRPDGSFTGSSMSQGTVDVNGIITVKDGKARYKTVEGRPTGIFVEPSGTLTLSELAGKKVLDGISDDGKVKFQFTKSE